MEHENPRLTPQGNWGNVRVGSMHLYLGIMASELCHQLKGPPSSCLLCFPGSLGHHVETEVGIGQGVASFIG